MSFVTRTRVPTLGGSRVALLSNPRSRAVPLATKGSQKLVVKCVTSQKMSSAVQLKAQSAFEAAQSVIALLKEQSIAAQKNKGNQAAPMKVTSVDQANATIEKLQSDAVKWQMAHASAQEVAKSAKLEAITLREKLTQEKALHDLLIEDMKLQTDMIKGLADKAAQGAQSGDLASLTKVTSALTKQAATARSLDAVDKSQAETEDKLKASHELIYVYEQEIIILRDQLASLQKDFDSLKASGSSSNTNALVAQVAQLQADLKAARDGSQWKDEHYGKKIKAYKGTSGSGDAGASSTKASSSGSSDTATLQKELKEAKESAAWRDQHYGEKIQNLEKKIAAVKAEEEEKRAKVLKDADEDKALLRNMITELQGTKR
eukprot:CAMPEP_0198199948 /NCGR_PEP_ID=MMETSP1445-20131203/3044_1 /TAXON_ID=36898 /ORGANISM="Pyramimonas sp., Strain CCMP2087" /LENGTH=374 /DNA_ID=CAMNT_0043869861 /DNA_START=84 /DNA_END=1208 /DNA_ORIENTATION=-